MYTAPNEPAARTTNSKKVFYSLSESKLKGV